MTKLTFTLGKEFIGLFRQVFAAKLLRCQIDMKRADEFNVEERRILEDLIAKRWIKKT